MYSLENYNERIIKHDLLNKFKYSNVKSIPNLNKITLNFGCKNFNIQKFATTFLALEIITKKRSTLTLAKNANVFLKVQKGQPAGCKVVLKKKEVYVFLTKLFLEILPRIKNFKGFNIQIETSCFFFKLLNNEILLKEFEEHYPLFADLPNLDVHISTDASHREELIFLIKSIKFPQLKKIMDKWSSGLRR